MSRKKIATILAICTGFAGVVAVLIAVREHLLLFEIAEEPEDDVYEEHEDGWQSEKKDEV